MFKFLFFLNTALIIFRKIYNPDQGLILLFNIILFLGKKWISFHP